MIEVDHGNKNNNFGGNIIPCFDNTRRVFRLMLYFIIMKSITIYCNELHTHTHTHTHKRIAFSELIVCATLNLPHQHNCLGLFPFTGCCLHLPHDKFDELDMTFKALVHLLIFVMFSTVNFRLCFELCRVLIVVHVDEFTSLID